MIHNVAVIIGMHRSTPAFGVRRLAAFLRCLPVVIALANGTISVAAVAIEDRAVAVPISDGTGQPRRMQGHVCIPRDADHPPLVIVNHGSPAEAAQRAAMTATGCGNEAAQWFLQRGYAVMFVLRLGYGSTGGGWSETFGTCERADYYRAGLETARQIQAMVGYARGLPYLDTDDIVLVGHSAGAWGVLAYDSMPHPHVGAFIDMAAGRGGYQGGPNRNCHPERLVEAARRYGQTASTPMLWIYAANDHFFAPPLARRMHEAFTTGDAEAQLAQVGSFGDDGHQLFFGRGGAAIWGPIVAAYLDGDAD